MRITYVMGGLARELGPAERLIGEWLDVADRSGMPVDPRLWTDNAPSSSFPACLAVKAAAEQGDPGPYLRRLREGLMCRRRRLDGTEALVAEARATPGLEAKRFRLDLSSNAIVEALASDLDETAAAAQRAGHGDGPAARAALLPALALGSELVPGDAPYPVWREAALAAGAAPDAQAPSLDPEAALTAHGTLATPEVAALCDLPGPHAPAELWRLALQWRAVPERCGTGELWRAQPA